IAELSKGGSGIVAKRSLAAKRWSASANETSAAGNGATADIIFSRAFSSLITRRPFNQQSAISNWQSSILRHILARPILVRWLSGRKQRFAKAPYPKRVPRVRIPPSPFLLIMKDLWLKASQTYGFSSQKSLH